MKTPCWRERHLPKVLLCFVFIASLVFVAVLSVLFSQFLPARKVIVKERDVEAARHTPSVEVQEWSRVKQGDVLLQIETNEFREPFSK